MQLENKIEITLTRQDCESMLGFELTDQDWVSLSSELECQIQENGIPEIVKSYSKQDIALLVEEDEKYR